MGNFDGYEYRGSLAKMGHQCHILGITKKIRASINKQPGDTVHVILRKDDEPRTVDIPDDFKKAMEKNEEAKVFFDTLSFTNQKQYVQWITSAKKEETRNKRLQLSIDKLLNKIKHP